MIELPTTGIDALAAHVERWADALRGELDVDTGLSLDEARLAWLRSTPLGTPSAGAIALAEEVARTATNTAPGEPPNAARVAELTLRVYLDDAAARLAAGQAGTSRRPGHTYGINTGTTLNALRDAQPRARRTR